MYTKEEIIDEIIKIRIDIGHENITPEIKELHYHNNELTIIAPDRPEKSIIIGKGGWVVGKLREKLQIDQIHVIAYSDIVLRKYQLELSINHVEKLINTNQIPEGYEIPFNNILNLLKLKHEQIYNNTIIENYIKENLDKEPVEEAKCFMALSGGADSSFSTLLSKSLGFNVHAVTVNPGTIILPNKFRRNIKNLTEQIGVKHDYLDTDMSHIIKDALNGKMHPCGRCSGHIESVIADNVKKSNIPIMIFGDLLSTGSRSIVKKDDVIRINMPALFRMEKTEEKNITKKYSFEKIRSYGCPLIAQVHNKYPYYKPFSIQRVLRETRAGILEPGEALDLIRSM